MSVHPTRARMAVIAPMTSTPFPATVHLDLEVAAVKSVSFEKGELGNSNLKQNTFLR